MWVGITSALNANAVVANLLLVLSIPVQKKSSPEPSFVPTIIFKVLHIYDSPGAWSGVAEFDEPIDVMVFQTSSSGFKVSQTLTLGVPLVQANALFDHKTVSSPTSTSQSVDIFVFMIEADAFSRPISFDCSTMEYRRMLKPQVSRSSLPALKLYPPRHDRRSNPSPPDDRQPKG